MMSVLLETPSLANASPIPVNRAPLCRSHHFFPLVAVVWLLAHLISPVTIHRRRRHGQVKKPGKDGEPEGDAQEHAREDPPTRQKTRRSMRPRGTVSPLVAIAVAASDQFDGTIRLGYISLISPEILHAQSLSASSCIRASGCQKYSITVRLPDSTSTVAVMPGINVTGSPVSRSKSPSIATSTR